MTEETDLWRELEAARATIATQAMQIHRLEQEARARNGTAALADLLQLSDVIGATIGEAPYRALLEAIVQAARRLFGAGASSIVLLDQESGELVFEASTDAEASDIIGMRFPAHQGIAGWVMMTGEPLAVADVRRDPRFARDFAQSTGYVPQSILAVPLIVGEDVEGVLEVLDKRGAGSFGLEDMELLTLFARAAALAVEQAHLVTGVGSLLMGELSRMAGDGAAETGPHHNPGVDETLELARLVYTLSQRGDRARHLATEILRSVAHHAG